MVQDRRNALYYHIEDECLLEEANLPLVTHSLFRLVATAFPLLEGLNSTPVVWPDVIATHSTPNLYLTHATPHRTNPSYNRRQRQKRKRKEEQSKPPMQMTRS